MVAVTAVAFGVLSTYVAGSILFAGALGGAAPPVPVVVWHDLLVGFAYIVVGVGLWRLNRWAAKGAAYLAAVTVVIYAAFGFSVMFGRPYDPGTALALALRFTFWTAVAIACFRWIARFEPLKPRE